MIEICRTVLCDFRAGTFLNTKNRPLDRPLFLVLHVVKDLNRPVTQSTDNQLLGSKVEMLNALDPKRDLNIELVL